MKTAGAQGLENHYSSRKITHMHFLKVNVDLFRGEIAKPTIPVNLRSHIKQMYQNLLSHWVKMPGW